MTKLGSVKVLKNEVGAVFDLTFPGTTPGKVYPIVGKYPKGTLDGDGFTALRDSISFVDDGGIKLTIWPDVATELGYIELVD